MTKHLIAVIDRSGSMNAIADEMNGGISAWLKEMTEIDPDALLTSVLFDSTWSLTNERRPLKDVNPESLRIRPRGRTALNDALFVALERVKKGDKGALVLVVTDGQENNSREVKLADVQDRVKKLQKKGVEFLYLSASVDAFNDSAKYGINAAQTQTFVAQAGRAGQTVNSSITRSSSLYLRDEPTTFDKPLVDNLQGTTTGRLSTKRSQTTAAPRHG